MNSETSLRERYLEVKERIARAAKRSGRDGSSVLMVAVSKYAEPDQIRELIKLGHADFGENKVQQLIQRAPMIDEWLARHRAMPGVNLPRPGGPDALGGPGVRRSGALAHDRPPAAKQGPQGGRRCRLIHSVDSLRLAEELQLIAAKRETAGRRAAPGQRSGEAEQVRRGRRRDHPPGRADRHDGPAPAPRPDDHGPVLGDNPEDSRRTFARCRELFLEVRDSGVVSPDFNILSMGMTGDFEIAIEEGANMVRVGSALFGEPKPGTVEDDDREAIAE